MIFTKNRKNKSAKIPKTFFQKSMRHWWFQKTKYKYLPPIFSFLDKNELILIENWYKDTNKKQLLGEANVPFMSFVQGLIMGNSIDKIIQIGHYAGFSTLLIGFMLKKMGIKHSFTSIDIDHFCCKYTSSWIKNADLSEFVQIVEGDSSDIKIVNKSLKTLKGKPKLIIIDSSHQYIHTRKELSIWPNKLEKLGLLLLHDVSVFASNFDKDKLGGVNKALVEFKKNNLNYQINLINGTFSNNRFWNVNSEKLSYLDGCGIGIIQKI